MRQMAFIAIGIIFALGLFLIFTQEVKADDVVIIEGKNAGAIFEENDTLALNDGENIVIVMPNGETRKITGPYVGSYKDAENTTVSKFESRGAETKVLGAVRAPSWDKDQ